MVFIRNDHMWSCSDLTTIDWESFVFRAELLVVYCQYPHKRCLEWRVARAKLVASRDHQPLSPTNYAEFVTGGASRTAGRTKDVGEPLCDSLGGSGVTRLPIDGDFSDFVCSV